MNFEPASIPGYRPTSIRKEPKEIRTKYLELSEHANDALRATYAKRDVDGANCEGRDDEFSGKVLPTPEKAEQLCLGCPAFKECELFLKIGRPSYGVWGGVVVDSFPHLNEGEDDD